MSSATTRHRPSLLTTIALIVIALVATAGPAAAGSSIKSRNPVEVFQPAGEYGGGVLTPGDVYAPDDDHNEGRLHRKADRLKAKIDTSGLPHGAYTVWWVVFHNPQHCEGPCDGTDLFRDGVGSSIFWATGGVVDDDRAKFKASYRIGDDRGEPGQQVLIDGGDFDPLTAEVHNVIKYHGPASSDDDVLEAQTTTALGSCFEGANAHWYPTGVRCADLQVVRHPVS